MSYNEADTRANLIDPKLNMAGWTRSQVTGEHYYRPDYTYKAGVSSSVATAPSG
jgi:type I restriction enzyme, R subunit